jgi:hypothetical protein
MAVIDAVITDEAREGLVKLYGGLIVPYTLTIDEFKVGEGGWETTALGAVRRTPDSSLTDLDAIDNPSRYPIDSRATFSKALTVGEMTFVSPSTLSVYCLIDFLEFNADTYGNPPEIWEIGLFSDAPAGGRMMVAYGTFPKQTKTPAVQLPNTVKIVLG